MRILHADTDDLENPLRGGQPVRTFAINSRLALKHQITTFTSVFRGCKRRQERGGVKYRRLGFRVPGFGLSPHLTFLASLGPVVARTPHDLVIEEFTPPVGFCLLPWWTCKPVVSTVQWYFFEAWEKRYRMPFFRWMKRIARTGRYRHFIVQTDAMARELRQYLPDATFYKIPSGLDVQAFESEPAIGDYALFLGRLDIQHKGLDLLLDSWRQCCAHVPLVIAGEGPGRPTLEARIAEMGLSRVVRLVGHVEGKVKSELIAGSRLLVMPSRYETFGIVAAEAMAAAKPVVSYDIDHLNEVVSPPWGLLISPFEIDRYGKAVAELWEEPDRCYRMGALARAKAGDFLWDNIAKQQEELYLAISNAHQP